MQMYYYLKSWFSYMDITVSDVFLFLILGMMLALGVYVFIKKNIVNGLLQMALTLFAPYMVCMFLATNKETWDVPTKAWIRMMASNVAECDCGIAGVALLLFILVPAWIIVTIKNISLLKR